MFGSELLEVAIGLVLIYLSISLICSGINELFAKIFGLRAKTLEEGLLRMFKDPKLVESLLNHPLIKESGQSGTWQKVSRTSAPGGASNLEKTSREADTAPDNTPVINIPRQHFVPALADILKNRGAKGLIQDIEFDPIKDILTRATGKVDKAKGDAENYIESERARIEAWFDGEMAKLSAWYKKKSQQIILVVSILLCGFFNVDTIFIGKTLYLDNSMREAIVQVATDRVAKPLPGGNNTQPTPMVETASQPAAGNDTRDMKVIINDIEDNLEGIALPLGWNFYTGQDYPWGALPGSSWSWVWKFIGILLTVMAVTLGAPFWYDILKKMIELSSSAKKP